MCTICQCHACCVLCVAVQLNCGEGLPEAVSEELLQDDAFLQKFHHALLEVSSQRQTCCLRLDSTRIYTLYTIFVQRSQSWIFYSSSCNKYVG
jgi:hypothetical protein